MRIGKYDVSTPTVVYSGVLLALLIIAPIILMSRLSAIRESWHRNTIMDAQVLGGAYCEPGIIACKQMIASEPNKIAPRLHLGCLLAVTGQYAEAGDEFTRVQDWKAATDDEKSLAMTGAACAKCRDGAAGGKPKNLTEAERLLKKALEFKETPDALAAMALVKSWTSGPGGTDVQTYIQKALAATPAPAPALLQELYRLNGVNLSSRHKLIEAGNAFGSVKVLDPTNKLVEEMGRLTALASITEPGISPAERRASIQKIVVDIEKFGSLKIEALLAIGHAWHAFKNDPDYLGPKGPFEKACETFKSIQEGYPRDLRAYRNHAGCLEERIAILSSELTAIVTGLNGESPRRNPWYVAKEFTPALGGENAPYSVILPQPEQERLRQINDLLRSQDLIWERALEVADATPEEKANAQLRYVSCLRRRYYLSPWLKNIKRDESWKPIPDMPDEITLNLALKVSSEAARIDTTGRGSYLLALMAIEKGELTVARNALIESAKRGFKSPEQATLLEQLTRPVKMTNAGPAVAERQFGAITLLRAAFDSPLGTASLNNLKVTINGKDVLATTLGSQVLYVPNDTEMSGGGHVVKFTAPEPLGASLTFPTFTYLFDKAPPTCTFEPNGGTVKGDVVFFIKIEDPSGVDWQSLSAGINSTTSGTGVSITSQLIRDGRYAHSLLSIKIKIGDIVLRSPVLLTGVSTLPSGDYKLWLDVKDLAGNKIKQEKLFSVK